MNRTRHSRPSRSHRPRRAFTLLEVVVVVTIIALLATLVAPKLFKFIGGSKQGIAQAEVAMIAEQVSLWMLENGQSTLASDFDLAMLAEGAGATLEPDDLLDPWDQPYILQNPGQHNQYFDVMSYGADGEPGGEGENADVVN